jgi:hypothetical protein
LAAIDCPKDQDKGGDNHSSKSVALPLTVPRRLTILNDELTPGMNKIRVEIKAEAGFDPQKDVNVSSLAFGSPEAVNFGHGTKPLESEDAGKDLIVTFDGSDQWRKDDFAAKLLGNTTQGELLFGYAKLPGERELEPILLPRTPQLNRGTDGNVSISVLVENFGQVQSATTSMKVVFAGENTKHTFTTSIPVIAPYGHSSVSIPLASISVNPRTNYSIEFIINPDLRNAEHFQTNEVKLP